MNREELMSILDYNRETGVFRWKKRIAQCVKIGAVAGSICTDGYRQIHINGQYYSAHRLAWLFVYGEWPANQVDHRNLVKDDNRIANLRVATQSQNMANALPRRNNTSGYKYVSFDADCGKWRARVTVNGVRRILGRFRTPEEAYRVAADFAKQHYGEFARV